jgi:hypothetical protein
VLTNHIWKAIVKAESLALVGAETFKVPTIHWKGKPSFSEKHILPHPLRRDEPLRYTVDGKALHSPDWTRSATYNADFIDAVVVAVSTVKGRLFK